METTNTITVSIKSVYGNQTIYPICDKARIFATMLGQKTLTAHDIANIKRLGFSVKVQVEEIKL